MERLPRRKGRRSRRRRSAGYACVTQSIATTVSNVQALGDERSNRPPVANRVRRAARRSHQLLDSGVHSRIDTSAVTECCCPEPDVATMAACPSCRQAAARVEATTVKALLTPEALARLSLAGFYFCTSDACDTVYFSDTGQVFRTVDVTVHVWHKQPAGGRTFCYCFGENEGAMQAELASSGRIAAIERVRHHIAERRCACEIRNPRGVCCLGDLSAAVRALLQGTS